MPGFDQLAKVYEPLERLTFAGRLHEARTFCLPHLADCQRGLLLGDGDGRFSSALLESNPLIQLDSIDISPRMLAVARERAGQSKRRLKTRSIDARAFEYPPSAYDFIGLHFVLDCFEQKAVETLLPKLESSLKQGGLIAYSDFRSDKSWQRLCVRFLYICFRIGAGLKTRTLPQVDWSSGFQKIAEKEILGGLVFSRVLQKN